jgi:hypothetical protein
LKKELIYFPPITIRLCFKACKLDRFDDGKNKMKEMLLALGSIRNSIHIQIFSFSGYWLLELRLKVGKSGAIFFIREIWFNP